MRRLLRRLLGEDGADGPDPSYSWDASLFPADLPLPYSWVLTNRLAVGPMPTSPAHWQQLEEAGLRSRFSCCYPAEESAVEAPPRWISAGVPLPDHRQQEPLDPARLVEAITTAEQVLQRSGPLYLHCRAGIERSPLVAVAITARDKRLKLLDALDWVRRCHPAALPIPEHLEILAGLLRT